MKLNLINISDTQSINMAAAMPYQSKPSDALSLRVWKSGHRSIARHSIITFEVEGISQDALRQLSRHPHINLTVKSTRYCDMSDAGMFMPEIPLKEQFINDFHSIMEIYDKWNHYGISDTAKLFLPLCSTTDLVMSGNVQAMYEFLQLRNCVRASEEIRGMAQQATRILSEQDGLIGMIFSELDCRGKEYGFCPEHKTCGKYPGRNENV